MLGDTLIEGQPKRNRMNEKLGAAINGASQLSKRRVGREAKTGGGSQY